MDVVAARAAGLDVHQATVVACALVGEEAGGGGVRRPRKERSVFPTTARGLEALAAWLSGLGVRHVCMEATGVYWMPVYAALEAASAAGQEGGGFELVVANAQHVKAVPGRKTDVRDAEWLALLVRHGLVRKSFVPAQPFRALRDLTRYRRALVEAQASERRRLLKLLEGADIKLAGVVSDVFGASGRAILRALIGGAQGAAALAGLARGRLRQKRDALQEALEAAPKLRGHQRAMLALQLARVEAAEADIARLDAEIRDRLQPYAGQVALLSAIPGIDWVVAATVIAEVGADLSSFPSAAHLAAWAGVCPGSRESAGKHKPARARKGNPYLKTALCNAATSAARKRGSYFRAKYHTLKARIGAGKAALAIAHKLLTCIYHVLSKRVPYRDLGDAYLDTLHAKRTANRCVQRLKALGFEVTITPTANAHATPSTAPT